MICFQQTVSPLRAVCRKLYFCTSYSFDKKFFREPTCNDGTDHVVFTLCRRDIMALIGLLRQPFWYNRLRIVYLAPWKPWREDLKTPSKDLEHLLHNAFVLLKSSPTVTGIKVCDVHATVFSALKSSGFDKSIIDVYMSLQRLKEEEHHEGDFNLIRAQQHLIRGVVPVSGSHEWPLDDSISTHRYDALLDAVKTAPALHFGGLCTRTLRKGCDACSNMFDHGLMKHFFPKLSKTLDQRPSCGRRPTAKVSCTPSRHDSTHRPVPCQPDGGCLVQNFGNNAELTRTRIFTFGGHSREEAKMAFGLRNRRDIRTALRGSLQTRASDHPREEWGRALFKRHSQSFRSYGVHIVAELCAGRSS